MPHSGHLGPLLAGVTAGSASPSRVATGAARVGPVTASGAPAAFRRDGPTLTLYAALGVFGALQVVPGTVTPQLREEFGYGYAQAGLHLSAYAVGSAVAGLAGPRLDRRAGRPALLAAGLVGAAVSVGVLTVGQVLAATLAAAFGIGVLGTLVLGVVQAGLSDHHGPHRAVAFSESNVLASVGATAAPLLVGAVGGLLGTWRAGVLVLAGAAVLLAVLARGTPLPPGEVPEAAADGHRLPPAARAGVALVFCGVVAEWCVGSWGATYLRDVVGLSTSAAVTGMACFFLAMLVGRVAGGLLVRTRDTGQVVLLALCLTGAGLVVEALGTDPVPALAGLVLLGLGVSVLFPLGLALAVARAPDRSALVSSRCITVGAFAVLLGPLVVGGLADAVGLRAALLVLPLALAGAAVCLRRVR